MEWRKNIYWEGEGRGQSCKLLRHLGTSCPVGSETTSRILKIYPTLFGMSRILRVTQTIFGLFLTYLDYFGRFWTFFDQFWLILAISLPLLAVGFGSMNQVPCRLRIICKYAAIIVVKVTSNILCSFNHFKMSSQEVPYHIYYFYHSHYNDA